MLPPHLAALSQKHPCDAWWYSRKMYADPHTLDQCLDTPLMWEGKHSLNKDEGRYTRRGTYYPSPVF